MLTSFLTWLRALRSRLLGRTPPTDQSGPAVTPTFGGRSR